MLMRLALRLSAFALLAGCTFLISCSKRPGPDVAATVNNRAITYTELDKFYKRRFMVKPAGQSPDQEDALKLEVLRTMIDNEIMLQRAEKAGLMATDPEVDTKFTEIRAPYTQEEFAKFLKTQNTGVDELKSQIRRELSLQKLINKEIASKISITDSEVKKFYEANRSNYNFPEPQFRIAQIQVTPQDNPALRNLRNDKAKNDPEARKKIETIAGRLKQGEDFALLAENYSEDPATASNGGDMGYLGESAFEKTDPELRKMIFSMNPGQISGILSGGDGYRILKMISKEPAGQRELSDPRVQQDIRNLLMNRKDSLLRTAYLEVARSEAKVVNYYARSILQKAGT